MIYLWSRPGDLQWDEPPGLAASDLAAGWLGEGEGPVAGHSHKSSQDFALEAPSKQGCKCFLFIFLNSTVSLVCCIVLYKASTHFSKIFKWMF